MGFGYLLIGYLISGVLYLSINGMGFGGLALLLGYTLMLIGLRELNRFHDAFVWSKWMLLPMSLLAVFDTVSALNDQFLWQLPIFSEAVMRISELLIFTVTMLFNLALLYAIRMISEMVQLKSMSVSAIRNMILVGLYAVLMLVGNLPIAMPDKIKSVLAFATLLLNIVYMVCNLLLLLACNKNICRKGDEEQTPRRSRLEWFNKIDDIYEKNKQKAIDSTREHAEDILRRRQAVRQKKNKRKK